MSFYQYPTSTLVNKQIPKNTFYQKGNANNKLEQLFIEQVEYICWKHKLAPSTIHLQDSDEVKEIQVFHIESRVSHIQLDILAYIDKLIPSPIIFEICYQNKIKIIATYKRTNQNDKNKVVIGEYYQSEWFDEIERKPLPFFHYLNDLYQQIISNLLPYSVAQHKSFDEKLQLNQQLHQLTQQLEQLKRKLKTEKQFNRKVEINLQIQQLQKQMNALL